MRASDKELLARSARVRACVCVSVQQGLGWGKTKPACMDEEEWCCCVYSTNTPAVSAERVVGSLPAIRSTRPTPNALLICLSVGWGKLVNKQEQAAWLYWVPSHWLRQVFHAERCVEKLKAKKSRRHAAFSQRTIHFSEVFSPFSHNKRSRIYEAEAIRALVCFFFFFWENEANQNKNQILSLCHIWWPRPNGVILCFWRDLKKMLKKYWYCRQFALR